MFKQGDYIVYGNAGVCCVQDISERTFAGETRLYYKLEPLYLGAGVIYTPAEKPRVFMRPVISRQEAERLITLIPSLRAQHCEGSCMRDLAGQYEATLNTHNCTDLIELTMTLYAKKQHAVKNNRKLWQVDEKYMKRAEELLFGELAVALEIPMGKVQDYIETQLKVQDETSCSPLA